MKNLMLRLSVFRVIGAAVVLCGVTTMVGEQLSGYLTLDHPRAGLDRAGLDLPPLDKNRITCESGFSMIAPEGWAVWRSEKQLIFTLPWQTSSDRQISGDLQGAREPRFVVTALDDPVRHPVPLPETQKFQGKPAYSVVRLDPELDEQPGRRRVIVVLERENRLFELCFEATDEPDKTMFELAREYLETFTTLPQAPVAMR